ncbi:MAG TPA: hypothetical protein VFE47_18360 [Tepidisphaeraceae bacterium]|jgi:hypothetical protein|nr:hypothetical protein [Tepidisphaeraceae bacterium]
MSKSPPRCRFGLLLFAALLSALSVFFFAAYLTGRARGRGFYISHQTATSEPEYYSSFNVGVQSTSGVFIFYMASNPEEYVEGIANENTGFHATWCEAEPYDADYDPKLRFGFGADHVEDHPGPVSIRRLVIPGWLPALLAVMFPVSYFLRAALAKNRSNLLTCANCGYDLRATPKRCPECGGCVRSRGRLGPWRLRC